MPTGRSRSSRVVFILLALVLGLNACNPQATPQPVAQLDTPTPEPTATPSPPSAAVTFSVTLLQPPPTAQKIYVDILDEVTGLAFHPVRHALDTIDRRHYSTSVTIPVGSVIKYRYTREGKPAPVEYNCTGRQVRYRMFLVGGADTVPDVICAWNDQPVETEHGRISGVVLDAETGRPIPDILVTAAGASALTTSDGSYLLENLPPGTHNLVFYSLDGRHQPYQQGAVVATEASTPASVDLVPAPLVNIEFKVQAPQMSTPNLPIRMIGNILSLGNTFSDLSGGISTVGYRATLLEYQDDGTYTIRLALPVGLDLRYKYTLGDGFWNGELDRTGGFFTRQLIVPEHDTQIQDTITTWQVPTSAPVTFTLNVPENTPPDDTVSIQFSGFGWTQPIPMWPRGQNTWYYILHNPHGLMPVVQYRFCRNDQCGIADDAATPGLKASGLSFKPTASPQTLAGKVKSWVALSEQEPATTEKIDIARLEPFWTGVEIQPKFDPTWMSHFDQTYQSIQSMNAGWVVLTPSWQYTSINPPVLEVVPGQTPLFSEVEALITAARKNNLRVALFPRVTGQVTPAELWQQARLDSDWWQRWFEGYRTYILHFADLAQASGAEALILDAETVRAALPGTLEYNHQPTHLPGDASQRWQALIVDLRARFKGQLLWTVRYNGRVAALPEFIDAFDQIYLLWSAPLAASAKAAEKDILKNVNTALKRDILPLQKSFKKPILIAVAYPSVRGAVTGCMKVGETCLPFDSFNQPFTPGNQFKPDFAGQSSIYRAILKGISRKEYSWIGGFISRGYYPAAAIQDLSLSVHGKPAEQTLAQWFAAFRELE